MDRERVAPERPAITPTLAFAFLLWGACGCSFLATAELNVGECVLLAVLCAAVGLVLVALALLLRMKLVMLALCGLLTGIALGSGASASMSVHAAALDYDAKHDVTIEALEDSSEGDFGSSVLVRVVEQGSDAFVALARLDSGQELLCSQKVQTLCTYKVPSEKGKRHCKMKGALCEVSLGKVEPFSPPGLRGALVELRSSAISALGGQGDDAALLQAIVCGYRTPMRHSPVYSAFQTCGLAHMVAVSGAHLVIVTSLFALVLKALRIPRRASACVLAALMLSYLVIAGMPVSALRACAMTSIALFSFVGKRRSSSMNALAIGIVAIVCSNPAASVSASFALSALSTAGIVLFSPLISYLLSNVPVLRVRFVSDALSLTLASSVCSQLYAGSLFSQIPVISPVSNVACAVLFSPLCAFGLVAGIGGALAPGAMHVMPALAGGCAHLVNAIVSVLAGVPFASVPFAMDGALALGISAALSGALWAVWPCDAARLSLVCAVGAVAVALWFVSGAFPPDRIVMLDVGQGDAFLVESRGDTLLIDTGNQDKMLLSALARHRIAHLDSVLVTHADDDHCGSLDALEKAVDVERVIVAEEMLHCEDAECVSMLEQAKRTARELCGVKAGDEFGVGAFSMRVVWPREFADAGGNADSLCTLASYDHDGDGASEFSALFTGDAEKEQIAQMVDSGDVGKVDVLKVGHHGSRNALTAEEAHVLAPRIALIGVGKGNRYGHPTDEVLDLLADVGCQVFRSDMDGDVTCSFDASGIAVARG